MGLIKKLFLNSKVCERNYIFTVNPSIDNSRNSFVNREFARLGRCFHFTIYYLFFSFFRLKKKCKEKKKREKSEKLIIYI
jgi:hypothetical protein